MLRDIKNIKSSKKELREFGITIGAVLIIFAVIAIWRGKAAWPYFLIAGALFIGLGIMLPSALKPFQKLWMAFSIIIGFFMSRLILAILFYLVITPMGLITRLLGKDILDQRIEKDKDSYWHLRTEIAKPKESYENQY